MMVIGLTGGIASGKSTISNYLKKVGAPIIDADLIAKELVEEGSPAWREIVTYFGSDILDAEKRIDRKKLGSIIFKDEQARSSLNQILHPKVRTRVQELINTYAKGTQVKAVVVDAPLLIEAGMIDLVDEVWLVAVPEEIQIKRVMERDRLSLEEARERIKSQMPLAKKLAFAHRVIDNSLGVEQALEQVNIYWKELVHDREKDSSPDRP